MAERRSCLLAILLAALALPATAAVVSWSRLGEPWPDPASLAEIPGVAVTWPSSSPFAPEDIGAAPSTTALGRLYLPPGPHAPRSVPAVVLLHGSGGILPMRELTYASQLARMGVAALVVDSFGARRERGTEFIERILNITETMALADAYSGLGFLAAHPEIDPRRVVLTGFARFEDSRTTGPLLMLIGGKDEIIDQQRCAEVAADLRGGGSRVETIVYPEAVHQWDGAFAPRQIGRNLAGCSLRVERDGTIRDIHTGLAMMGPFMRKMILGLCTLGAGPYPIARDDRVRAQAAADYGRFLARIFAVPPRPGGS